jgi:carbon-monoxide dehydrogenase large subunit
MPFNPDGKSPPSTGTQSAGAMSYRARPGQNGIGAEVRRTEDLRFVSGAGRYVDDQLLPGQCFARFVRSPHAHAIVTSVDVTHAAAMPGVIAVFTGRQMRDAQVGSIPCGWLIHGQDGRPMAEPPHHPLAVDKVRHVGDPVAVVIAETVWQGAGRRRGRGSGL